MQPRVRHQAEWVWILLLGCSVLYFLSANEADNDLWGHVFFGRQIVAKLAIPRVDFARGQRKDEVMHEHLARFEAAGRREGVLFIGRAQEKNTVFRTEKRRAADGRSYPWIVRTTSVVNQFY